MRLIDLFCGGGGSSTGFHQAGFETSVAVDFADHAVATFNANYPDTAIKKDISNLRAEPLLEGGKPVLVTASPPCEAYTTANEKRVKDPYARMYEDEVGRLMIHAIRLIADLQPEFFMIENVMGIFDGDGRTLLQEELNRLGLGKAYFNTVQATDWGVPSNRLRAIITNFKINPPKIRPKSLMEAIGDLPAPNYPHDFEYHITPAINEKYEGKLSSLQIGEALVHFKGAKDQMRNWIRLKPTTVAPTVMGKSKFVHPFVDRILTPQEHARLMTFPDNYKYEGTFDQIYDIIGEAVPPRLTFEIGKQAINLL
ncbi:MAG: DNA cytosine methyltransferase [Candidatus Heimdallarchaeota archaeon]|nr:DNA cytosine methyltransferase [Candidatus Heimdallarchaeota archaeon]